MAPPNNLITGTLYIVATPIGNLEDITLRAIRILKEVDLIAAEDTRHTKKLLNHFSIDTPLISYYREKEFERSEELISRLHAGTNIALVSDAGTPGISDPGAVIVNIAHKECIPVVPLAGPSALTTALSASGIQTSEFLFLGFAPSKKSQRRKLLSSLVNCETPVVFYESPHRIESLLSDSYEILGNREAFWARELTKKYEDLKKSTLEELRDSSFPHKNRGDSVVIICPGEKEEITGQTVEELLIWYRDNSELSLKDVSRKLANDLGLSRSQIYQEALKIWKQ
jgi:16S rRNA (cytidine1402-2'-O)-methyltransferase